MPKQILLPGILILILSICPVCSLSTEAEQTGQRLNQSASIIQDLEKNNLSAQRIGDLFIEAKQIYEGQVALEKANGTPDFRLVYVRSDEIANLSTKAYLVSDELNALKSRIEASDVNASEAQELYFQALEEFRSERYEQAENKIDAAYAKTFQLESTAARMATIYEATSDRIQAFLQAYWIYLLILLTATAITAFAMRRQIQIYLFKRQLKHLETKKKVLKKLIARAQREYFEKGVIGEDTYHIRISRFGELVRDLDRQVPLVKEKIAQQEKSIIPKKSRK